MDTKFFEGGAPETEEIFRNEMAEFGNNLHVLANDEPLVVSEWEKIDDDPSTNFQSLLVGTTERMALENFIEINIKVENNDINQIKNMLICFVEV